MIVGSFDHTIDPKNRVFIPSKWREELGGEVVINPAKVNGKYKILELRSAADFEKYISKFSVMRETDNRDVMRLKLSQADNCTVDKQGRILLKDSLKKYAGFGQNVTLSSMSDGVNNVVEIWDTDKFYEWMDVMDETDVGEESMKERGL